MSTRLLWHVIVFRGETEFRGEKTQSNSKSKMSNRLASSRKMLLLFSSLEVTAEGILGAARWHISKVRSRNSMILDVFMRGNQPAVCTEGVNDDAFLKKEAASCLDKRHALGKLEPSQAQHKSSLPKCAPICAERQTRRGSHRVTLRVLSCVRACARYQPQRSPVRREAQSRSRNHSSQRARHPDRRNVGEASTGGAAEVLHVNASSFQRLPRSCLLPAEPTPRPCMLR